MTVLELGLVVAEPSALDSVRPGDGVALAVVRGTLLDMPRTASARRLGERIHERLPDTEIVPYAWHFVTHAQDDRLPGRGARSIEGDLALAGHLGSTPEVETAWEATTRAAKALGASHVVLRTPLGFAPGSRGRNRLVRFVEAHREADLRLVWEPEGLWEPEECTALATQLDLILMVPPRLEGDPRFDGRWVVQGIGGAPAELRGGADQDLVEMVADSDAEQVTLLFAGSAALKNLRRVRRLWRELASSRF